MPALPYRDERPLTPRQRRWLLAAGVLLAAALVGALVWAQLRPNGYGASADGCVNVTTPSSLGGSLYHRCGADARTWCQTEYAAGDRLAKLVQPQCRLAGITPEPSPASGRP